jgi:hypothetical protein
MGKNVQLYEQTITPEETADVIVCKVVSMLWQFLQSKSVLSSIYKFDSCAPRRNSCTELG